MSNKETKANKPAKTPPKKDTKRLGSTTGPSWIEMTPDETEQHIAGMKADAKKAAGNLATPPKKATESGSKTDEKDATIDKNDGVYNPTPDSGGASPVEHNLGNGLTMLIDRQSSFKPEYCQKLIEHMKGGESFESFGFMVGVGRTTLYKWIKSFPIFKDAYDLAWSGALKFWEDLFKAATLGLELNITQNGKKITLKNLDSNNIKYMLSRRFKELYAEKQEIEARTTNTNYEGGIDVSQLTGEQLDKRQKDLESQLAGTRSLIAKLSGPNPLEESDT